MSSFTLFLVILTCYFEHVRPQNDPETTLSLITNEEEHSSSSTTSTTIIQPIDKNQNQNLAEESNNTTHGQPVVPWGTFFVIVALLLTCIIAIFLLILYTNTKTKRLQASGHPAEKERLGTSVISMAGISVIPASPSASPVAVHKTPPPQPNPYQFAANNDHNAKPKQPIIVEGPRRNIPNLHHLHNNHSASLHKNGVQISDANSININNNGLPKINENIPQPPAVRVVAIEPKKKKKQKRFHHENHLSMDFDQHLSNVVVGDSIVMDDIIADMNDDGKKKNDVETPGGDQDIYDTPIGGHDTPGSPEEWDQFPKHLIVRNVDKDDDEDENDENERLKNDEPIPKQIVFEMVKGNSGNQSYKD